VKFLLKSPFDTLTGYGSDGVGIAHALMELGHDVHPFATTIAAPIPEDIARLFTKWPAPPFDAVLCHLSPTDRQADSAALRTATERLIFWTMWEYENFRISGWEDAKPRFENSDYDLMLAYDEVTQGAMADPEVNPGIPIRILQGGYEPEFWAQADPTKRDWSGTFRFGMAGRLHNRKGPWAAVKAFRALKQEHGDAFDAELHLKTTLDTIPKQVEGWTPGIHIHFGWWPHERMREFYESLHCYLAPSVGEGKNLPALEAQTAGVPVIGTLFGGHTGWMSPEFAYPVRFEVKEMNQAGLGASVDEEHLAELMWHVYTHRAEAKQKGAIAARTIPASMSWRSVMSRLIDLLNHWPFEDGRQRHEREGRSSVLV
jgi:glycosyltransferase involved in cell wall biosynthesis